MHHHARGLVDDDDVGVLVEDLERQVLGRRFRRRGRRHVHGYLLTGLDCEVCARLPALQMHVTVGDQLLDLRAGELGQR
jgi:hypothetical protein